MFREDLSHLPVVNPGDPYGRMYGIVGVLNVVLRAFVMKGRL
jgi:hypothetical protein